MAVGHFPDTVASIGVEGRGSFYDSVGALRDVVQNHLLQVVALVEVGEERPFEQRADREAEGNAKQDGGEQAAGELDTVAAIAGEENDHVAPFLDGLGLLKECGHGKVARR